MKKLKELRKASGLSQHNLARKSGVPRWRIAYVETGRLTFSDQERSRIRVALARSIGKSIETARAGLGLDAGSRPLIGVYGEQG